VALIIAAGILSYATTLANPLLFDDENAILNNATIRSLATSLAPPRDTPVAGRPLVNLSFALNYATGGLDVRGYRAVNIAIHIAAALLLFGIVRRTLRLPRLAPRFAARSTAVALVAALFWLLHPLQTEAVNYLSERTESLMGLFYLLTLYCAVRGSDPGDGSYRGQTPVHGDSRWQIVTVVACAMGMLCKESMVTAPVIVMLYDRVFLFDSFKQAWRLRRRLYLGLAATWIVLALLMAATPRTSVGFASGTSAWTYLLNQAELVPRYLWLSIWPRSLVLDYGLPRALIIGDVIAPALLVVALLAATIVAFRRAPMLAFLGAWVFITLAPTSSIVPIATEVGAERRMYLALAALMVLLVIALSRLGPRTFAAVTVAIGMLMVTGTMLRNQEYRSRLTMAETIVERRPHGRAHFLLGSELIAAGRREAAMQQLRISARDYPGARFALATEMLADGPVEPAIAEITAFLSALPTHASVPPARDMLGRAYLSQGRFAEAAEQFRIVAVQFPGYRGARNDIPFMLGYALAGAGRFDEALPVLQGVVNANPADAAARDLLGRVRVLANRPLTNRVN
jgi:protein O-mannosyl-transferase